jgi:USP6 N-terminal-like protein
MITTSERQVLLPRPEPFTRFKQNSSSSNPSPLQAENSTRSQTTEKEQSRIEKWERMILPVRPNEDMWRVNKIKEHKLRERVYKGIPDRWRRAAWDLLILSFRGPVSHGKYTDLLNEPSEFDIQIDLDVPRTISGHIMFRTRYGLG